MANPIAFRGTAPEFAAFLNRLPALLSGSQADTTGITFGLKLRIGVALLSQIQQDFIRKSRGQTGKDGIKWPPLKPGTIARRRTTRQERKALGILEKFEGRGRKRVRVLRRSLTKAEDAEWKKLYSYHLRIGLRDMPRAAATKRAAAIAWARMKERGATTLLQKLGSRQVDILRDTGALLRSLSPGVEDRPSRAPGQVFNTAVPGSVIVGTYEKPWHHEGNPAKGLPARPFWPLDNRIPAAWWPAVRRATNRGIALMIQKYLGG